VTATYRAAGLSIDVDSVSVHLKGYGIDDALDDGASYRIAIPRALELLGAAGARATFFLIAEEAARYPEAVRSIVAAGHEVGCHSMTHRLPFDISAPERARREIGEARAVLEDLAGEDVIGFRAPGWEVGPELVPQLRAAGFRYDASSFPSWMFLMLRWRISRRSSANSEYAKISIRDGLHQQLTPHVVSRVNGHSFVEIPLCTVPLLQLPYYHTLGYLLPDPIFRAIGVAARARRWPSYVFHAVDFLEVRSDRLDARIARHPGMDRPLAYKLDLARRALADLGRGRSVVPLRTIADHLLEAGGPSPGGRAAIRPGSGRVRIPNVRTPHT
jgi:hypothetical protein